MAGMTMIRHWNPEDRGFGSRAGRPVTTRNLVLSIPALTLAFAVWMLWSAVVVHLPAAGFAYSTNQLFWLTALPALSGATLRLFCAFALPLFGGRHFTALATASLLLPALGIGFAVQDPGTPYEWMVALALLCGLGGGNFASSMANIRSFLPHANKGCALGLNAGFGHLGVALVQLVVPLVIGVGTFGALGGTPQSTPQGPMWLQNAGFVWVPLIAASALAAWFGMDDLADAKVSIAEQAVILTGKHNWLMCWLLVGTFGSFIGFSASMPLLIENQFPGSDLLRITWLGPLLGALMFPLGGWLADRFGGGRITSWAFGVMALGVAVVLQCLPHSGQGGSAVGSVAGFVVLFVAAGIGSGSSLRMIPGIFVAKRRRDADALPSAQAQAAKEGSTEAAAALGFASAIGAYGGFFIPKSHGTSIALTGSPAAALQLFFLIYCSCQA
jgi:NNP family nitrate/nitrite transporter-like MFS transporter